jgi:hypothetical protein
MGFGVCQVNLLKVECEWLNFDRRMHKLAFCAVAGLPIRPHDEKATIGESLAKSMVGGAWRV